MDKKRTLPKIKILDKQHLNVAEVTQTLQALGYPADKIISQADHDGFINAEIITTDLLRAALNNVASKADKKDCLIILKVGAEARTFVDVEGENNHYVALHFSNGKITYIDPTGDAAHPQIKQIVTQKFPQITFENCEAVLQYTNPQYDDVYQMGGNDYDCGALVALGADMIRRNFNEANLVRLNEVQSKKLGQIMRKIRKDEETIKSAGSEIQVILEDGKLVAAEAEDSTEELLEEVIAKVEKLPQQIAAEPDSSDKSPDSSDEEYGAKTIMRKVFARVSGVEKGRKYRINQGDAPIVSDEEIKENPNKYFVVNFRGDRLDYFPTNDARRRHVKELVDSNSKSGAKPYRSIAAINIDKEYDGESEQVRKQKLAEIGATKKLGSATFVKTYKSPPHFKKAVERLSSKHGNPVISTSKSPDVTIAYADHPDKDAKLHPKYNDKKKPKHRLIGMESVFIHEANEYIAREKADIEKLRAEGEIGGKGAVERENQEIMFANEVESKNVAGYVPMVYPNLSAKYSDGDMALFGMSGKSLRLTKGELKTLGPAAKRDSIYPLNRDLQWKMAEKFAKAKNPQAELLWVDSKGDFRKFEKVKVRESALIAGEDDDSLGVEPLDVEVVEKSERKKRTLPMVPKPATGEPSASTLQRRDGKSQNK